MGQSAFLQDQAYDIIKEKIQCGAFDASTIYSLNTIAKELNMSKTPVRDAFQRLSREGAIEILPSRGIRVVQYSPKQIVELFQARYAISDFCCTMLALKHSENPNDPIFKVMEKDIEEQEKLKDGDFDTYYETDWQFHMRLIEGVSNRYFYNMMEERKEIYRAFARNCVPHVETVDVSIREHRAIYEGICEGNIKKGRIASYNHLTRTLRANLKEVEGIDDFISKMIPVELISIDHG